MIDVAMEAKRSYSSLCGIVVRRHVEMARRASKDYTSFIGHYSWGGMASISCTNRLFSRNVLELYRHIKMVEMDECIDFAWQSRRTSTKIPVVNLIC